MTDWTDLTSLSSLCVFVRLLLCRKDMSGALEAAIECHKLYKHMPRIHELLVGMVGNGDTDLLQKGCTFVSPASKLFFFSFTDLIINIKPMSIYWFQLLKRTTCRFELSFCII